MQHRYVSPSVLILTTTYERPYFSDRVLPVGNLRELKSGVKRADIILVTKCPDQLSENKIKSITNKIIHQFNHSPEQRNEDKDDDNETRFFIQLAMI